MLVLLLAHSVIDDYMAVQFGALFLLFQISVNNLQGYLYL